jgi:rod shape-determining protein MreC
MNRDSRRVRLVLTLLVLVSLTLIGLDYRDGRGGMFARGRSVAGDVFGPIERVVADAVDPVGRFVASLGNLDQYKGRAEQLARENEALREQLDTDGFSKAEAAQLSRLMLLSGAKQDKIVPARVIGASAGTPGLDSVVQIDVGSRNGIRLGETVVAGDGLVGTVQTVGSVTSTVLLAIDPSVVIGARLAANELLGTVTGRGLQGLVFTPDDPADPLTVGAQVVTLGAAYPGDRYAADIEIGTITSFYPATSGNDVANVKPAVDFARLDVVGVIVGQPSLTRLGPVVGPLPRVTVTVTVTARARPRPSGSPGAGTPGAGGASPGASPGPTLSPTPSG